MLSTSVCNKKKKEKKALALSSNIMTEATLLHKDVNMAKIIRYNQIGNEVLELGDFFICSVFSIAGAQKYSLPTSILQHSKPPQI